ncbi:MAG: AMP-binding protein [Myxococcota bacterium]
MNKSFFSGCWHLTSSSCCSHGYKCKSRGNGNGEPGGEPSGYSDLDEAARSRPQYCPAITHTLKLGDPCFYIFTSGTTGLPKASIMSHHRWAGAGRSMGVGCLRLSPGETLYAPLPLYHNQALTVGWGSAMISGAALAIRRKFSVSAFWDDCRRHNAGAIVYIGEVPRYLFNRPPRPDDRSHQVRRAVGLGLRNDIWRQFKQRFGVEEVYELYAASELNLAFVNVLNLDCTVGICPLPWALVQYDSDSGEPVRDSRGQMVRAARGEVGLLLAKVTRRYKFEGYTDEAATERKLFRNVFKEGDEWVNSGDLMRNIGFGHLQFVDRIGDTFRWKSENVATGEVERIIHGLPAVTESTVYGVEVPGTVGRAGMAAIVASAGQGAAPAEFDLGALLDHLRTQLPAYAVPVFVRITDTLQVTGTFKHRKVELRKQGYDPSASSDPIYVLLPRAAAYQSLTAELYQRICAGEVGF